MEEGSSNCLRRNRGSRNKALAYLGWNKWFPTVWRRSVIDCGVREGVHPLKKQQTWDKDASAAGEMNEL